MSRSPEFYGRSRSALPPPAGGQSGAEVQKPPGVPGYEGQWRPFETEISGLKLELADRLSGQGKGRFELADCEVKSNWVRIPGEREKRSRFLHGLAAADLTRLTDAYFDQVSRRHTVIMAIVVDKRFLHDGTTHETLHMTAYEFLLDQRR